MLEPKLLHETRLDWVCTGLGQGLHRVLPKRGRHLADSCASLKGLTPAHHDVRSSETFDKIGCWVLRVSAPARASRAGAGSRWARLSRRAAKMAKVRPAPRAVARPARAKPVGNNAPDVFTGMLLAMIVLRLRAAVPIPNPACRIVDLPLSPTEAAHSPPGGCRMGKGRLPAKKEKGQDITRFFGRVQLAPQQQSKVAEAAAAVGEHWGMHAPVLAALLDTRASVLDTRAGMLDTCANVLDNPRQRY